MKAHASRTGKNSRLTFSSALNCVHQVAHPINTSLHHSSNGETVCHESVEPVTSSIDALEPVANPQKRGLTQIQTPPRCSGKHQRSELRDIGHKLCTQRAGAPADDGDSAAPDNWKRSRSTSLSVTAMHVHEPLGLPDTVQERQGRRRQEGKPQGRPVDRPVSESLSAD